MHDHPHPHPPDELGARRSTELPHDAAGNGLDTPLARRSFLKAAGFTFAGAGLAACGRAPIDTAIPYLVQPEEITPGRAYWQASTCGGCAAACGVLVKCRDGRPIKLEGLPEHPRSRGGLCAVGQASVLSLYDAQRLAGPRLDGRAVSWSEVDAALAGRLTDLRGVSRRGGRVRFLTGALTSPTLAHWVARFLAHFADGRQVTYDPLPASAILEAHRLTHGVRRLPRYRFARAEAVVAFGADFLGTWISPVAHTKEWRETRRLDGERPTLSWHAQLEPRLSLTGAKADRRVALLPSEYTAVLAHLAVDLAWRAGVAVVLGALPPIPADAAALAEEAAARLWAARGRALVVCDHQDVPTQVLVNLVNHLLDGYGATLDLERPSFERQGDDAGLAALLAELEAGAVDALFVHDVNPLYDLPIGERLRAALGRVPLVVALAPTLDETAAAAHAICPPPHALESWGDAEAVAGTVGVFQPTIAGLGHGRAVAESLATWLGEGRHAYDLVRAVWQTEIHPRIEAHGAAGVDFETFWTRSVHDGFSRVTPLPLPAPRPFDLGAVAPLAPTAPLEVAGYELVLYPKTSQLDGRHAHNPWLQELPDPLTKIAWDNYVCLAPETAAQLGVEEGDEVRVAVAGGPALELPAHLAPGQHPRAVAVALGYGRAGTDRFAGVGPRWWFARRTLAPGETVGRNAAPLAALAGGLFVPHRAAVALTRASGRRDLACTQPYSRLEVPAGMAPPGEERRAVVEETTLAALVADPQAGASPPPGDWSLWPHREPAPGPHWGMAIDLTACTGCAACVVSCQAENNVPVVGKDEVLRAREMHWIRIDRYFEGSAAAPSVAFQPMLCQHCGNAPCETVCPVLATVHSAEGLNQQIYNRCVGTRYCANNCPYKVRRFNWFDYPHDDRLANMALNPDVVVRSRGVMEKCSLCVQRIQEAKAEAKRCGTPLADGAIATACEQSCPAEAIVFGDLADPTSRVARAAAQPRHYHVLAELNVKPVVGYLRLVRNRDEPATTAPATAEETQHG